jgi:hypothetical protein
MITLCLWVKEHDLGSTSEITLHLWLVSCVAVDLMPRGHSWYMLSLISKEQDWVLMAELEIAT